MMLLLVTQSTLWRLFLDHVFTQTFVEKIEKSMNLLIVCKLYLASLAWLLIQDKKSMQLNLNVSSQSNRSTVLQATAESLN